MRRYIRKANVLIEALPYIQHFRNKVFVIKFGGSVIGKENYTESVLQDIVFLECIGINPVVIHGGGHYISETMKKKGIQPKFIQGLRVTDDSVLEIVKESLSAVNRHLAEIINSLGGKATGVMGSEHIIKAKKHYVEIIEDSRHKKIDIGYVGNVVQIFPGEIFKLIQQEFVPVIAPLGFGEEGEVYNINADISAGEIAASLKAEKLIFLTDVEGIMRDPEDSSSLISTLKIDDVKEFIRNGTISGGMIPKVNSCLKALKNGVTKTHIIDGRIPHSLLLEIFTDKGIGTEIVK